MALRGCGYPRVHADEYTDQIWLEDILKQIREVSIAFWRDVACRSASLRRGTRRVRAAFLRLARRSCRGSQRLRLESRTLPSGARFGVSEGLEAFVEGES
ncbi:hypothetical protein FH972_025178 [Carpinus fangiana]|uniref:Uncharacterized protein n=1 Tax=Carpinus fangiana TaxID=176857 RepID=A0A5N6L0F0_9ROSI|nr:hypothetical protein FH972_025178 [Carpinus fangiana]